jgi:hypothetical protein
MRLTVKHVFVHAAVSAQICGQGHNESRSLSGLTFRIDRAIMLPDYTVSYRKSEAGPLAGLFCCKERFKYMRLIFFFYSFAGV